MQMLSEEVTSMRRCLQRHREFNGNVLQVTTQETVIDYDVRSSTQSENNAKCVSRVRRKVNELQGKSESLKSLLL